tara:strand:+ start:984 stop:1613 length:630 start_codon:yes stop_codon:yes gene_type:complete
MRSMNYLHINKIIYRRFPITDKPSLITKDYMYYEDGTHECYELFRSKAKITTTKSLIWHLTVIWYLNQSMTYDEFKRISDHLSNRDNNFVTFTINQKQFNQIIEYVYKQDLERPPKNKLRKIIFKDNCTLDVTDKLKIVGSIIGKSRKIHDSDIYDAMLYINDNNEKITTSKLSMNLKVTTRTIYRRMTEELNKEKTILNKALNEKIQY